MTKFGKSTLAYKLRQRTAIVFNQIETFINHVQKNLQVIERKFAKGDKM